MDGLDGGTQEGGGLFEKGGDTYPLRTMLFPKILMIKESCNLIGGERQLPTPNQK